MEGTPRVTRPAGRLFVVATPIGNLEDITLRALRVLREVALVAAEDTRRTGNLLRHYDIRTPLLSVHEHNEPRRATTIVERLQAGDSVALVSDAGTPGISDPGAALVRAVRDFGLVVEAVPGASAVTTALSVAGLSFDRFAFAGFPPVRSKNRIEWFGWVQTLSDVPVVFFEAPHRIRRTLEECRQYLVKRQILIGRELTKTFEEWSIGTAEQLLVHPPRERGEFVLVACPQVESELAGTIPTDAEIAIVFGQITDKNKVSRRAAIREAAESLGTSPKIVYAALERHKTSVK
jgi:16S rRNA (cytidine1402-2'-O)-methyltransferase